MIPTGFPGTAIFSNQSLLSFMTLRHFLNFLSTTKVVQTFTTNGRCPLKWSLCIHRDIKIRSDVVESGRDFIPAQIRWIF
jgi:hypothetical protein